MPENCHAKRREEDSGAVSNCLALKQKVLKAGLWGNVLPGGQRTGAKSTDYLPDMYAIEQHIPIRLAKIAAHSMAVQGFYP